MNARNHGLNSYERQIMDLWDSDHSIEQIAALTGFSRERTGHIISYLSSNRREDGWQRGVAAATDALAARIIEVHGVMT